jgi:glycosyltransferase involved in cell wall biosynthesis
MRVLQLCSAEGLGGGETHVADLSLGLVDRGHHVELAVRPSSRLPELFGERRDEVTWHRFPFRNAVDLASMRGVSRIVAGRAIDLVHAHVARDYPIAAMGTGSGSRATLVCTRHHYLPIKGNVLYRRLLARATIVAVSESVRRTVLESLRLDPSQVVTVPNWIDLERYRTARDRSTERSAFGITRRVAVGLVGQLTPLKGQKELLEAAARIVAERRDVEFLVVGEDTKRGEPYRRELERLSRDLGLDEWVRFLGYERDLPGLLAALDVVAVPSWNEAFSLITAEAMASARPVVASRAGALAEIIDDGVTGLLVEPHDIEGLARAIARLAADPALAERLGGAARSAAGRFAREPAIDATVAVYERALATMGTG